MMRDSRLRIVMVLGVLLLTAASASAQIDITGTWAPRMQEDWIERGPGRDIVDYTGLPLSDEARAVGLTWEQAVYGMIERQCILLSPYVTAFMPQGLRIWSESDGNGRIVAWKMGGTIEKAVLTIWMDGRPAPSENAPYSFSGFTTGKWEGDTLTTRTTHIKAGHARRGNGSPSSDRVTVSAHITRHEDLITVTTIQEDPIYLTEPFVVSRTWQLDPRGNQAQVSPCFSKTEVPRLEDSNIVPHIPPGENIEVDFMTKTYGIPREAALGYAETTYPEYRKKMQAVYKQPAVCTRYCCGWLGFEGLPASAPGLACIIGGGYGPNDKQLLSPALSATTPAKK